MVCEECHKRLKLHHTYTVQGKRYGMLPGVVRVYVCQSCWRETRTLEVKQTILTDQRDQFESIFQKYIKENASLQEKIRWLTMPCNQSESRLKRIRQKVMEVMELTF